MKTEILGEIRHYSNVCPMRALIVLILLLDLLFLLLLFFAQCLVLRSTLPIDLNTTGSVFRLELLTLFHALALLLILLLSVFLPLSFAE